MARLRPLFSAFVRMAIFANAVGAVVIFALVAIMNADVVARGIFHAPINGVVEIVIFSLILIVFLQLPDVVRSNRLTRSDGFLILADNHHPLLARFARRIIDAMAAVFMALIAWTVWPEFFDSIETCHFITPPEFGPKPTGDFWVDIRAAFGRCQYFGTPGIFTAPWWPAKLAISFSVSLCAILFAFKAFFADNEQMSDGSLEKTA
jgi:hypothetical protein